MRVDDVVDAVYQINNEIQTTFDSVEYRSETFMDYHELLYATVSSAGWDTLVKFGGVVIWHDDNDEREWIEKKSDYEPLDGFLRKRINEISRIFNHINLEEK